MSDFRYSLLSDGSSDKVLLPIITWLLHRYLPDRAILEQWADLRRLPNPPRTLKDKIFQAIEFYPCDMLFIHRDAENQSRQQRLTEILAALREYPHEPPTVCVIPIRMQEAWLLFDEDAIRKASGNPNGRIALDLPSLRRVEEIPNPKDVLHNFLKVASELTGRRWKKLNVDKSVHLVAEYIQDFSPLRTLSAFQALEDDLRGAFQTEEPF